MVDLRLLSTPVGLVISPTRFPCSILKPDSFSTSIPVFTRMSPANVSAVDSRLHKMNVISRPLLPVRKGKQCGLYFFII